MVKESTPNFHRPVMMKIRNQNLMNYIVDTVHFLSTPGVMLTHFDICQKHMKTILKILSDNFTLGWEPYLYLGAFTEMVFMKLGYL